MLFRRAILLLLVKLRQETGEVRLQVLQSIIVIQVPKLFLLPVFDIWLCPALALVCIGEVHESASWFCVFFLSPLLNIGSSDRSHSES